MEFWRDYGKQSKIVGAPYSPDVDCVSARSLGNRSRFRHCRLVKGPVNLYISKSADSGATWSLVQLDTSASPPDCSAYFCGWAYLGAQITMTSDSAGTLYALWNAGTVDKGV